MKIFNVLDPNQSIRQSLVLEASAGTGKTFSIENIVLRALLESSLDGKPPLSMEDLLVVTFTKAAAYDLRKRIRSNLIKKLECLECRDSIQKIKRALIEFDRATICTIHAFCYRALQEYGFTSGASTQGGPEELSQKVIWEVIERYFRTALTPEFLSPIQLNILLKPHRNQVTELTRKLIKIISRGIPIRVGISNSEGLNAFRKALKSLHEAGWTAEKFLSLIDSEGFNYYGFCQGNTKIPKSEYKLQLAKLANVLERDANDFGELEPLLECSALSLLTQENLKKNKAPHHLFELLQQLITPLIEQLGSYAFLFARLASGCQKAIWQEFEKKDKFDFTYLLMKMGHLTQSSLEFRKFLQKRYQMVMIDEFQDTDPLQWGIFKELFINSEIPLILVGDPKQSIYAFRSADIYTYLEAAVTAGPSARYILNTNYRSSPKLIDALNHLFHASNVPGWISLPALKSDLPYFPVQAPPDKIPGVLSDGPALQFLGVDANQADKILKLDEIEEKFLFPRFVIEVRDAVKKGVSFNDVAFLVRDRAQSERLMSYLQSKNIPVIQQNSSTLAESAILDDLSLVLHGILTPRNLSAVQAALGTCFFKWTSEKLEALKQADFLAEVLSYFYAWHDKWYLSGIGSVLHMFLNSSFGCNQRTILEEMLLYSDGIQKLHELNQFIEWLADKEYAQMLTPESLLYELDSIKDLEQPFQEKLKLRPLVGQNAVSILTMHMSKGLEFELVFVLGLINRPPVDVDLISIRENGSISLSPSTKENLSALQFLEENDAEKARQLYVAMTRAKEKVIVPIVFGWKPPSLGKASPLELHCARMMQPLAQWQELYERLKQPFKPFVQALCTHPSIDFEMLSERSIDAEISSESGKILLNPPAQFAAEFSPLYTVSFTRLSKKLGHEESIDGVPHSFIADTLSPHLLPAGSITGELLHHIMEEISFEQMSNVNSIEECRKLVRFHVVSSPYEHWEEVIAEMIFRACKIPLGDSGIVLDQLKEANCYREMEFLYPTQLSHSIAECFELEGMVKGVIDLFFEWKGKYYLLDWKTNWLGPSSQSYSPLDLVRVMQAQRYNLQADLYRIAIKQYLKQIDRRSFEECFGGIFYLFLRGFDGQHGLHWIKE